MANILTRLFAGPARPSILPVETSHPVMRTEPASSFLWLDLEDSDQQIQRRQDKGSVTHDEAVLLEQWATNGYVILSNCVPPDDIDAAREDVDRAWRDRQHVSIDLLRDGRRCYMDELDTGARTQPYKINDFYLHSESIRRIFLNERIVRFGELIFDTTVVGVNSLVFERGSQQAAHVDHIYMTPTPARRLFASWVALEDVSPDAGPLQLWPSSHKLPPYDFGPTKYHYQPELEKQFTEYLSEQKVRFPFRDYMASKGDVLLWHAMLIHGGAPINDMGITRWSMACHYFSQDCFGVSASGLRRFGRASYMSKGVDDPH